MIKGLKRESASELYHFHNGKKVLGKNELMLGNCTGLSGDCTGLSGDLSGLWGNCTGLWGSCTGLSGNLDLCEITDLDRQSRINIRDLIQ